jgi:glycosyltransferase involved in cell wall biosynthesis
LRSKISILLAVYNGEKYIIESINSVLNQLYSNWELIIVDNGSTDNTSKIVDDFVKLDNRILFYKLSEKGKCRAYNYAFTKATGDYICYFAADDILTSDSLDLRINILLNNKAANFSTCLLETFSLNPKYNESIFPSNINKPNFSGGSIFFTKDMANLIFPIPEILPNEDTWSTLVLKAFGKNIHISKVLYKYRIHDNNSNGYDLPFQTKKNKFLERMSAYNLFISKYYNECDYNFIYYLENYIKGVKYCNSNSRILLLFNTKIAFKEKIVLLYYTSNLLYKIRNIFFKITSGLYN